MLILTALLFGCTESLDLPTDPSEPGVPVGVQTLEIDGHITEIWYPATQTDDRLAGEVIDMLTYVPDSFIAHLGSVSVNSIETSARRDAEPRRLQDPLPVIVFSHGFGGMRVQSANLATHLASRGYVVLSTDHSGRSLGDVLPCLFSPALDGCDLSGFGSDPAEDDLDDLLDALPDLANGSDLLGANSTTTIAQDDERIDAFVAMAGGQAVPRDVPGLYMAATCDGIISATETEEAASDSAMPYIAYEGAGHLAFSDLCDLQLTTFAEANLLDRDDLDPTFSDLLIRLAGDGCADGTPASDVVGINECSTGFVLPQVVEPDIRGALTTHFDAHL
jgi:hypothetical protein